MDDELSTEDWQTILESVWLMQDAARVMRISDNDRFRLKIIAAKVAKKRFDSEG